MSISTDNFWNWISKYNRRCYMAKYIDMQTMEVLTEVGKELGLISDTDKQEEGKR